MRKKWVMLAVFLVAIGLVSIWNNTRADLATQVDVALRDNQYDKALLLLRQMAEQNKDDPKALALINMQMVICKSKLNFAGPAASAVEASPGKSAGDFLNEMIDPSTGVLRVPHPAPRPDEALAMSILQLGNFPFDPLRDATVPDDVMALDGHKITMRGYINLWDQSQFLTDFAITPSLGGCCNFGQPAGVQHTVICHAPLSRHYEFVAGPVVVTGRLTVKPVRENDFTQMVFQVEIETMTADEQ